MESVSACTAGHRHETAAGCVFRIAGAYEYADALQSQQSMSAVIDVMRPRSTASSICSKAVILADGGSKGCVGLAIDLANTKHRERPTWFFSRIFAFSKG